MLLTLILTSAFHLFAQRFNCIDINSEHFFLYNHAWGWGGYISGIKPDSVTMVNNETYIWHYRTTYDGDFNIDSVCENNPIYSSWIGKLTLIKDNIQYFFNINNDTIRIETSGNPEWYFYKFSNGSYFKATVDSIEIENVIGIPDSVFTFSIHYFDSLNQPQNHLFDGKKIKIAKNYGFLKTFNFRDFPLSFVEYNKIDAHRYKKYEVFGYQLGDELHWNENASSMYGTRYNNDRVIAIDTISANEIHYSIERKVKAFTYQPPPAPGYWTVTLDTITEILTDPNDYVHDLMPEQSNFTPFQFAGYYYMWKSDFCDLIANTYYYHGGMLYYDTCYNQPFEFGGDDYNLMPSIGHRSYYYYDPSALPPASYQRTIVYYSTIGFSCGNASYIGISENEFDKRYIIYPNPASSSLSIINKSGEAIQSVSVFDIMGKEVKKISQTFTNILVDDLPSGVYFVSIKTSNSIGSQKLIIEH